MLFFSPEMKKNLDKWNVIFLCILLIQTFSNWTKMRITFLFYVTCELSKYKKKHLDK